MAKQLAIGVVKTLPIFGNVTTNLNITASNISTPFTVSNGSYYFQGSGTTFTTNNKGVNSSTASTTLTAKMDMTVSFTYSWGTESGYDKFTLTVAGTTIQNAVSGTLTTKTYSGSLKKGQTIYFSYTKDSSSSNNGDQCTFSDMKVSYTEYKQVSTETKSVASLCKKSWIGVNNKARKIKKIWIGDANSKARLCWGDSARVAYYTHSNGTGTTTMYWSDDYITWNKFTLSFNVGDMYYVNGYFVATGGKDGGYACFSFSKDCVTWTHKSWGVSGYSYSPTVYSYYMNDTWWVFAGDYSNRICYSSKDLATWTWDNKAQNAVAFRRDFGIATVGGKDYYCAQGGINTNSSGFSYCPVDADVSVSSNWTLVNPGASSIICTPNGVIAYTYNENSGSSSVYLYKYSDSFSSVTKYTYFSSQYSSSGCGIRSVLYDDVNDELFVYTYAYSIPTTYYLNRYNVTTLTKVGSTTTFPPSGFMPEEGVVYNYNDDIFISASDYEVATSPDGITWTVISTQDHYMNYFWNSVVGLV